MNRRTLLRRNVTRHWRANLAVMLGVVVATATLTGALLVGDSMRGSLRAAALGRLGRVDLAVRGPGFFREKLADDLIAATGPEPQPEAVCPLIVQRGTATQADSRAAVHGVSILGVDARFAQLADGRARPAPPTGRHVILNQPLADELRAACGDDVLLRIGRPASISPETLLGRRDSMTVGLRLTVEAVVPAEGLGAFSLRPRQAAPRVAFVPLATLQQSLDRKQRVNALLISMPGNHAAALNDTEPLETLLQRSVTLADLGLRLRVGDTPGSPIPLPSRKGAGEDQRPNAASTATPNAGRAQEGAAVEPAPSYIALESDALLLSPAVEDAARAAIASLGCKPVGVLTYLANEIRCLRTGASIPYSTISAIEPQAAVLKNMVLTSGRALSGLAPGEIVINSWAAADLDAAPGDTIVLSYYTSGPHGRLETKTAELTLRGVVRLERAAADPGLTPAYPGLTDADTIAGWDPPFPIDMGAIRPRDEAYWDHYRATPKAFVALSDGQRLWADQPERFGRLTSLRAYVPRGESATTIREAFEARLLKQLDPARLSLAVEAVRARASAAARGTTDFAGLFVGFSFFLIVSAALLVALLFRLAAERRAREIGLLLAIGFEPRRVARGLLLEGVATAAMGAAVGLLVASGYAWLMLAGLRSWWSDAVNAPFLRLHTTWPSYVGGYLAGVLVASAAIAWSLRGLLATPPRALLVGVTCEAFDGGAIGNRRRGVARWVASLAAAAGVLIMAISLLSGAVAPTIAFFVGGTALLIAGLAGLAHWLRGVPASSSRITGAAALLGLGIRNARRHAGRSLLTAALIASASFVITALQSMRLTTADSAGREGGTGGFALMAELDMPLTHDLSTPAGRDALGLSEEPAACLRDARCYPLRLSDGDETSCLNLYQPTRPRILGATEEMIARGDFAFAQTLADTAAERANPWTLLHHTLSDGAVPAIADEAAALWQLHLKLGDELTIQDERGRDVRLRLVALLKGSILQGDLIVAEDRFTRMFPSISGYRFYLIEAPGPATAQVEQALEQGLTEYGFAATPTTKRLEELHAVQNTYISTFQSLGGLGLLLGTLGLAAVMLRNVWERRAELALMRSLGFSNFALGLIVLAENGAVVLFGLLVGVVSAALVVAPHMLERATPIPWGSLLLMFAVILLAGLLAGALALIPALRTPLLPALRSE